MVNTTVFMNNHLKRKVPIPTPTLKHILDIQHNSPNFYKIPNPFTMYNIIQGRCFITYMFELFSKHSLPPPYRAGLFCPHPTRCLLSGNFPFHARHSSGLYRLSFVSWQTSKPLLSQWKLSIRQAFTLTLL